MPRFDVRIGRDVYQRTTVEIEAENEKAAEVEALRLASEEVDEVVWDDRDWNGPKVERVEERR